MTRARWLPTVALFALVTAACSSGTPTATGTSTASDEVGSPAPTTSAPKTPAEPSEGSPEPAGEPASRETSSAPAPEVATVDPPLPGTYRYAQDGETRAGVFTIRPDDEGTLDVASPEGNRQRQVREFSSNQSLEQVMLYRKGGVFLESFVSRFATSEIRCDLEEPIKVVDLPLTVGTSWKDTGRCDGMTLTVSAKVTREVTRTVGGERVDTFVLNVRSEADGEDLRQTSDSRLWVSPDHRLIVRVVESSEGTADGQRFTSSRTDDLLSLEPR